MGEGEEAGARDGGRENSGERGIWDSRGQESRSGGSESGEGPSGRLLNCIIAKRYSNDVRALGGGKPFTFSSERPFHLSQH